MARILALEECPTALRNSLLRILRPCDEAIILPQGEQSIESGAFKNIVCKLQSGESDVPIELFSPSWFCGVSAVRLDDRDVEPLLRDPVRRKNALQTLAQRINSEVYDSDLIVGPELDADSSDRDKDTWNCGFDSTSCCVGLYCSEYSKPTESSATGQNRVHRESYLVCRAGGGVAASTFHARLTAAIRKGKTLEQALEGGNEPGPQAFRRVSTAGSRNRAMILAIAAKILGFHRVETLGDQASRGKIRGAVANVDVQFNVLRKLEGTQFYQYSTCVDCLVSKGAMVSSNVADGFCLLVSPTTSCKIQVRNDASSCIPFSSMRLISNRDVAIKVTSQLAKSIENKTPWHTDIDFLLDRFSWKNRDFGPLSKHIFPLGFYGTHIEESFFARYARELGISHLTLCRLRPEAVCTAGVDPGKLRGIVRSLPTNVETPPTCSDPILSLGTDIKISPNTVCKTIEGHYTHDSRDEEEEEEEEEYGSVVSHPFE
tara:strand:- start:2054 stop:3517 length:1464 start_codon:yes stop_codon:yes gene_type:complete